MKRRGILNAQLIRCLATLGHTDTIAIADCGLPIPEGTERIDLALVQGVPTFREVVSAVGEELVVQKLTIAEEMREQNSATLAFIEQQFSGIPIDVVTHEQLKAMLIPAKAVIRTGENTPFANVILECGVAF